MIEALSHIRAGSPQPGHAALNPKPEAAAPGASFAGDFSAHLAESLRAGERAAIAGIAGELPMHQAVQKVLEAERTLATVVAARDKFISAYLELTRMQI